MHSRENFTRVVGLAKTRATKPEAPPETPRAPQSTGGPIYERSKASAMWTFSQITLIIQHIEYICSTHACIYIHTIIADIMAQMMSEAGGVVGGRGNGGGGGWAVSVPR